MFMYIVLWLDTEIRLCGTFLKCEEICEPEEVRDRDASRGIDVPFMRAWKARKQGTTLSLAQCDFVNRVLGDLVITPELHDGRDQGISVGRRLGNSLVKYKITGPPAT